MLRKVLELALLLALGARAVEKPSEPRTITLELLKRNNTSASSAFRGMNNGNAASSNVSKLPLSSLLYGGNNTRIYARVVPFFLKTQKHVDVGYQSDDPAQVNQQIEDMISRGISGAIVDWYGTDHPDLGRTVFAFRVAAEHYPGFSFVISEDKGALKVCARKPGCDLSRHLIEDLNYAFDHFESNSAYLRRNGRPVVFFFDVNQYPIDWSRVRKFVKGNPLFVFRNAGAFSRPESDGAFAWVDHTGKRQMPYLDDFYRKATEAARSRSAIVFGSVYKGFDDRAASWSENRVTNQECGQIWLDTFARLNSYFSVSRPLEYLQVVTWNDYEEGTEIESGIDNCVEIQLSLKGGDLKWVIAGKQETIDHFVIYASQDGERLTELEELSSEKRSWSLRASSLPAGRYKVFVEAIGKPSMTNKVSPSVSWDPEQHRSTRRSEETFDLAPNQQKICKALASCLPSNIGGHRRCQACAVAHHAPNCFYKNGEPWDTTLLGWGVGVG